MGYQRYMNTVTSLVSPRSKGHELGRRIFHEHIRPYGRSFVFAIFLMILAALSTSALPYMLQPVFGEVFTRGTPQLLMFVSG